MTLYITVDTNKVAICSDISGNSPLLNILPIIRLKCPV